MYTLVYISIYPFKPLISCLLVMVLYSRLAIVIIRSGDKYIRYISLRLCNKRYIFDKYICKTGYGRARWT